MKHALAEERAPEADAVEAADQRTVLVDLDGVAIAALVELAIEIADARIDPGAGTARHRRGATADHGIEIAVDDDGKLVRADGAGEARRHVEAVERNDAAIFRFDPIQRRVFGAFRHREDAAGIGLEQHFRRDLDDCGFAAGHRSV